MHGYSLRTEWRQLRLARRKGSPEHPQARRVRFEQAAEVFFDPFLRMVDASRNDEARDAVIGYDMHSRLLYVVHIVRDDEVIRIISARKATPKERQDHDS